MRTFLVLVAVCLLVSGRAFAQEAPSMVQRSDEVDSHVRWSTLRTVFENMATYRGSRNVEYGLDLNGLAHGVLAGMPERTVGEFRCFERRGTWTAPNGTVHPTIWTSRCVFDVTYGESGHRCEAALDDELAIHFVWCRLTAG